MNLHAHRKSSTFRTLSTSMLAIAAAFTLAACNRHDDNRTAGQKLDATVNKAEQKADEVKADMREAGKDAARATSNAATAVGDKVKDAAITTAVKTKLASDPTLSAFSVNVDTVAGHVALHGSAPDAASRERAATMAAQVDGVSGVDNQLVVSAKN